MGLMVRVLLSVIVTAIVAARPGHADAQCVVGGREIPSVPSTAISDVAMATMLNGAPVILVNPGAMQFLSPTFTRWIYWHECGHHALGHVAAGAVGYQRPYVDEQEADCFGIRKLVAEGIGDDEVSAIQLEASQALGEAGDPTHLPAIVRAMNLRACIQASGRTSATRAPTCKTTYVRRPVTRYRPTMEPRRTPCQHVICNPYGCGALHGFDVTLVPVQEPYIDTEMVPQRECSDDATAENGDDYTYVPPKRTQWQYEYLRDGSDVWLKSITFSSEESCDLSRERKDALSNYLVLSCEELE